MMTDGLLHYAFDENYLSLRNRLYFSSDNPQTAPEKTWTVSAHTNCDYVRKILFPMLASRSHLELLTAPMDGITQPDIQWDEYENIDWKAVLRGEMIANSYCVRKGLSRKAQLSIYLSKYIRKHPNCALKKALPRTIVVDTWEAFGDSLAGFGRISFRDRLEGCLWEVRELFEDGDCGLWIMKPSATNKGAEVNVISDYKKFQRVVYDWLDIREWVVQKYIENPLLVKGRKFHLRAYVLAVGSLKVYLFSQVLVLTAMEKYEREGVDNDWAHITNTAHQQDHPLFVEEECIFLLSDLPGLLTHEGVENAEEKVSSLFSQMEQVTREMFEAYRGEFSVFQPLPNCFELFGVDFLVDEDFSLFLLEANCGPDLKNTGGRLQRVIERLIDDTIFVALDELLGRRESTMGEREKKSEEEDARGFVKVYDESWGFASKGAPKIDFH